MFGANLIKLSPKIYINIKTLLNLKVGAYNLVLVLISFFDLQQGGFFFFFFLVGGFYYVNYPYVKIGYLNFE